MMLCYKIGEKTMGNFTNEVSGNIINPVVQCLRELAEQQMSMVSCISEGTHDDQPAKCLAAINDAISEVSATLAKLEAKLSGR